MLIQSLASSSGGNCYRVSDGTTSLLLEAGISLKKIAVKTGHTLSALAGCLVSHEHGDHSKAVKALLDYGVPCYMSWGTADALGLKSSDDLRILEHKVPTVICGWKVLPFHVIHDAAEPMGFLIDTGYEERLLFLTDTGFSPFRFAGLTHMLVECNYRDEDLWAAIEEGRTHESQLRRLLDNHMSEETLVQLLLANDLRRMKEIHLIHLSDNNSDEAGMKERIQRVAGCPVYVSAK